MPVTAPARNASARPAASPPRAACAVRTLARTETFMPMKPAAPESTEPIKYPKPERQPSVANRITKITTPTIAMVRYCRLR